MSSKNKLIILLLIIYITFYLNLIIFYAYVTYDLLMNMAYEMIFNNICTCTHICKPSHHYAINQGSLIFKKIFFFSISKYPLFIY